MNFSQLPYELQFKTLLSLPYQTILNYCQTNRVASQICDDDTFWNLKLRQEETHRELADSL
jgi:hypothetical protein